MESCAIESVSHTVTPSKLQTTQLPIAYHFTPHDTVSMQPSSSLARQETLAARNKLSPIPRNLLQNQSRIFHLCRLHPKGGTFSYPAL